MSPTRPPILARDDMIAIGAFFVAEGHFSIPTTNIQRAGCSLRATITLRADDRGALVWIRDRLGGTLAHVPPKKNSPNPGIKWELYALPALRVLCECVDVCPIDAKKKREVELFRAAIGHPNVHYRAKCGEGLKEMRRFNAMEDEQPNVPKDGQLQFAAQGGPYAD